MIRKRHAAHQLHAGWNGQAAFYGQASSGQVDDRPFANDGSPCAETHVGNGAANREPSNMTQFHGPSLIRHEENGLNALPQKGAARVRCSI